MEVSGAGSKSSADRAWATHAALLVVQLAFGSGAVEGKLAMRAIAPEALAMLRMGGAAIFFVAVTSALGLRRSILARDHAVLAGLALLGVVLNQTLFLAGLRLTSALSASLLGVTIPVFTAVAAILLGHEKPRASIFAGLALAASGVVWLTGVRSVDRGAVLVALNSLSYALYVVFARRTFMRLGAFTVLTWVFVWAAVIFAPVGMTVLVREAPTYDAATWMLAAYVMGISTVVAYLFNAYALARAPASTVTAYIFLQPVVAALLGWAQLGAVPQARTGPAAVLIVCGVAVATAGGRARRAAPAPRAASAPEAPTTP